MTETPVTEYLERARELGPDLEAAADEIERRRELPEPIVEALIDRGLFRLLLPRFLSWVSRRMQKLVPFRALQQP